MPYTIFNSFVTVCKDAPETVIVTYDALRDAKDIYKLDTKEDLLQFIGHYHPFSVLSTALKTPKDLITALQCFILQKLF